MSLFDRCDVGAEAVGDASLVVLVADAGGAAGLKNPVLLELNCFLKCEAGKPWS